MFQIFIQPQHLEMKIVNQIKRFPRFICAAPSYLQAQGIPQDPKDLKYHTCLHYGHLGSGCQWLLIKDGNQEKICIDPVFCANNGEVLRDAAIKGLGIVMLPDFILNSALERGELQIILPDYQAVGLSLCIFYPLNRHLSTKVQLFTQFIQESFA